MNVPLLDKFAPAPDSPVIVVVNGVALYSPPLAIVRLLNSASTPFAANCVDSVVSIPPLDINTSPSTSIAPLPPYTLSWPSVTVRLPATLRTPTIGTTDIPPPE